MSEFPIQTRTIDPYSSYNSNVVNQLTRMITRGKNCLHGIHAIDVVIDSTSTDTEIVVLPGEGFKDDVILQIGERKTVDMADMNYYINHLNPFNEAGYYYVCIEYTYAKSRPAPEAKIRLLKPSQTHLYDPDNSAFLLLKIVNVIFNGTTFEVDELFDFDPSSPTVTKIYSQLYAGVESALPPFDQERDEGRLVYVSEMDEMYFGLNNQWESFNAVRSNLDTSLCQEGELVYIGDDQFTHSAIATSSDTFADCIVMAVGDHGKVRLMGETEKVKIETGVSISYGDSLYLSGNEAGTITNNPTFPTAQFIGISVDPSVQTIECDIWFLPNRAGGNGSGFGDTVDFYQDLLHSSVFERLFIEPFSNNDFIDTTSSNIIVNSSHGTITGGTGDIYQTVSLQEASFNSRIHIAQITSKLECTGTSSINWFISNNGSEPLDWESVELDKLHNFSTYRIAFSSSSNTFVIGENVISSVSNKMATINGINSGEILVFGDTRLGVDYVSGETITGQTSGATGIVSTFVNRQNNSSYYDLRVKIEFVGIADECVINDYGVIYDQDEDIFNKMPSEIDIQANLDTLYLDVYTWPSQDDDGNANLVEPLETQIRNLEDFVDNTCCVRLDQVEDDIVDIQNELATLDSTAVDALIIQVNEIDNDINTLYTDIYETPSRDGDGVANRVESVEETLANLQTQITALGGGNGIRAAMFVTTADATPDVQPNPSIVRVDYASPLTITDFDNGSIGQEVIIVFTNANTIIQHNANIHLLGSVDFQSASEYILTIVNNGTRWIEKSRSVTTAA